MSETTKKPNYRKTLNLPQTPFDMRAKLMQNEPISRQRWEGMGLIDRMDEARADAEPFVFHDGPPYANGSIHIGHIENKVLKDIVLRSRLLAGHRCRYVPGWDCHGLPIEHKVMTRARRQRSSIEKLAALDDDTRGAWRSASANATRYAEKWIVKQSRRGR